MIEVIGDLFSYVGKATVVCIPTNGNRNGVMGAGVAKIAANTWTGIDRSLAYSVGHFGNVPKRIWGDGKTQIFSFPTKHDYSDETASLELIAKSAEMLVTEAETIKTDDLIVAMPEPGTGCGKLLWSQVKPILKKHLDDRFVVVRLKK
jgi:hypothetical protein